MTLARPAQCNRQYPCNHCARRRCPEECAYSPSAASQTSNCPERRTEETRSDNERKVSRSSLNLNKSSTTYANPVTPAVSSSNSPLAELFGYFVDNDSNTLALIRKVKTLCLLNDLESTISTTIRIISSALNILSAGIRRR